MSRRSRNRSERHSGPQAATSFLAPPWTGAPFLKLVREFNEQFLEKLAEIAQESGRRSVPEMVRAHRDLWVNLDASARERAGGFSLLLADIHFRDAPWWCRAQIEGSEQDSASSPAPLFADEQGTELMRHALFVAWRVAQQDVRDAEILLAMSNDVAVIVASLGFDELRHIAQHHNRELRPRWEHLGAFWSGLLSAAIRNDRRALNDLRLYVHQLAEGDALAVSAPDLIGKVRN